MKRFIGYERGVNLGGWISQCVSYDKKHFDTFITEEDIKRIAGWGLDHLRLPVDDDIIMNEDGSFREEGFSYIDQCIAWCEKYRLNMILDLHKTKGYMFDTNVVPNPDLFFEDTGLQDTFIHIWEEFTGRYGKYANRIVFELLNEVVNPNYAKKWNEIAARAIRVIRTEVPDMTIIVGGTNNNSVMRVPEIEIPFENIVYTFHCYEPMAFTHQKAYWVKGMTDESDMFYPATIQELREKSEAIDKDQVGFIYDERLDHADGRLFDALFEQAVAYADAKNVPLYCGEYGVLDRAPLSGTVSWLEEIHDAFEKNGIGRAIWNYKDKDFGIVDEHYQPMQEKIIRLL